MICDVCKVHEAKVHMAGEGDYCLDCHNARIADIYHFDRLAHFTRRKTVHDAAGRPHRFSIANILMPNSSEWTAEEGDDGYRFSVMVKPEDDQAAALDRLHCKMIAGLQHQTLQLQDSKFPISNALQTSDGQYCLSSTGSGRIEYDRETVRHRLVIDGRPVSASDFLRMLSMYEGYNLIFQIQEPSDDILEKNMVLDFVRIDAETIIKRFEECLGWFLDRSFLSYKRESACGAALIERIHEFELLCHHGKPETARAVGQVLIDRLLALDHDTDDFPEVHVAYIRECMPAGDP